MLNVETMTGDAAASSLNADTVRAFEGRLAGQLIRPGDNDYNRARAVWNGMIDRRPALIARCANVQDVVASVHFARDNGLQLAVRGGGHNVAGHGASDGGLVIDLSPMRGVVVDPESRRARAQGGAIWGDVDHATQAYGLATPGGVVSDTGIAGLTLGGGYGHLRNKHGLSCDNLISAEVVLADGRVVRANQDENPELLWGLRGGGGNFGIVTEFEYHLYPVGPEVMFTFVFHDGRDERRMAEALRFFREYTATSPDEVSVLGVCGVVPDLPAFPDDARGVPTVLFAAAYAGPVEAGERVLAPLRNWRTPLADLSDVMPYVKMQTVWDEDYPKYDLRYYWKSTNLTRFDDEVIERITHHAIRQPSPLTTTDIWHNGGAIRRVPEDAAAYTGRNIPYLLNAESNWKDAKDDEANITWTRAFIDAMQPYSDGGRYLNFAGFQEEGDAMMKAAFQGKYERLAALKRKYDPANLFRLNQNIKP